ncbi:BTB/POZ domain-containing protein DOT3 [Beta vulgaris subsp. vulgaris]|uniref:BTB/POZ domain-containing protein DOT3 n=1 Tax=Beta vulgaris subsp. vulgaris TaxID=3555 RepID=UPI00254916EA|nr:BTB/POZ domain-containing protein DOT3 [Beta vulgaris subsp. vulgaris]
MKKHALTTEARNQESSRNDTNQIPGKIILPNKNNNVAYSFEKKDHSWFVVSDIPTDLSIQIEEDTFHVHKYALFTKSGYISQVDFQPTSSSLEHNIKLDNFPGGATAFEVVLKFCYGQPIDLNPNNVALLRCASEFLEMTEEFEDGNLISKTEAFLTFIVLASWRDSIIVLKTCENLSPWGENLQIVRRCCDSISWKAFQDKNELIDNDSWWFDDVATLRIDHFSRIIAALKSKGTKPEIIGSCLQHYAEKWLPRMDGEVIGQRSHWYGKNELQFSIISGTNQEGDLSQNKEQKMIIESLISLLPPQKEAVSCKFLLWMLKMAMIYSATPALISELEKRVGSVLNNANVQDLLIPRCGNRGTLLNSPEEKTMHNIDTVQRIVEYFLMHEQQQHQQQRLIENLDVSKLLDNYLAEIASEPNLTISKFQVLAEALPANSRLCHDGLYRAIDTYLKTHPSLPEQERRRLCKIMNCQKLSIDACMHVAQNERLPMKTIIQVLFSEQVKMRTAMQSNEETIGGNTREDDERWSSAKKEIKILRTELEKVKEKMSELQRDYSELQGEYIKQISKPRRNSSWIHRLKTIRQPSFFSEKIDTELGEEQGTSNPGGNIPNSRRRQSMP